MLADAVTTKASIAEVARMAASSNLRIQLTSFAAQTVPAPGLTTDQSMEASETHSRGRRTNPAAPRITAAALTPPPNRRQARETHASTCGSHPVPGRNATSAGSTAPRPTLDSDRGYDLAVSSGRLVDRDVSLADHARRKFRRDRSPPLSRAPLPLGCATSNCPAMLNENRLDLTTAHEFCVWVF